MAEPEADIRQPDRPAIQIGTKPAISGCGGRDLSRNARQTNDQPERDGPRHITREILDALERKIEAL